MPQNTKRPVDDRQARGSWLREDERDLGVTPRAGSRAPYIDLTPAAMLGGGARRACPPRPPRAADFPRDTLTATTCCRIADVLSPELLEVLACPKCKQKVELNAEGTALVCEADRLRYPIVDGIPVMLIEEAESF
jgi:uncharacterized protein YbaR (Trm112 family)